MSQSNRDDKLFVGSLEKGYRVLEAFRPDQPELGIVEIVQLTGLNRSAVQRFTHTLHQLGYLEKNAHSRRYSLSHMVLGPANTFLRSNRLVEAALPHVTELRRQFGNRAGVGHHIDTEVMYLIALQSNRAVYATAHPGFRIPAYCTSTGRAILAFLPTDQARDILNRSNLIKRTEKTLTDPEQIMDRLVNIRQQGFAITINELNPGEINMSAPIFDGSGTPIGGVATASRVEEWSEARIIAELVPAVTDIARVISQGYPNWQ